VIKHLEKMGVPYTHSFLEDFQDLPRYFHALDTYLVTSREEGGPKAITESMASGVPILTTNVGMAPDLVTDGINGGLVEVEDTDGLARRALKIASNKSHAQSLISYALDTVPEYDWINVAQQHYDHVYSPMLDLLS
jgi:glycosyltransferase involved in cell wall biosynthesis